MILRETMWASISSKLPAPNTDTADFLASFLHNQSVGPSVGHKEPDAIILHNSNNLNRDQVYYWYKAPGFVASITCGSSGHPTGSISVTKTSMSTNLLIGPTIVAMIFIVFPGEMEMLPICPGNERRFYILSNIFTNTDFCWCFLNFEILPTLVSVLNSNYNISTVWHLEW